MFGQINIMQELLDYYDEEIYDVGTLEKMMGTKPSIGPWAPLREMEPKTEPLLSDKRVKKFLSTIYDKKHIQKTQLREAPPINPEKKDTRHKSESTLQVSTLNKSRVSITNCTQTRYPSREVNRGILKKPITLQSPRFKTRSAAVHIKLLPQNISWQQESINKPIVPKFNIWRNVLKGHKQKKREMIQRSLFYLGSSHEYQHDSPVAEVSLRTKHCRDLKRATQHLAYSQLPRNQKLLRHKRSQNLSHNLSDI